MTKKPPRARPATPRLPSTPTPGNQAPGSFTIDSRPFAKIYIDGGYAGDTPLFRHALRPGSHSVRAVLESGRQKTFSIVVVAEQELNSGTLAW